MKCLVRNSIIFLVDALGIAALYRVKAKKRGPLVRVIVFHDVQEREWFDRVVLYLCNTYNIVTPEQFHNREFDQKRINVLFTFDDGYQSWIDVVLPVLNKNNVLGIFFVCSGLLEIAHNIGESKTFIREKLKLKPKKPLSWEGARMLVKEGHTIGGHTISHANLPTLSNKQIKEEIETDKKNIEQKLNIAAQDFAYPFGKRIHISNFAREIAKQNYQYIYSAEPGFNVRGVGFDVNRMCIEKKQSTRSINRWIGGAYDIFNSLK